MQERVVSKNAVTWIHSQFIYLVRHASVPFVLPAPYTLTIIPHNTFTLSNGEKNLLNGAYRPRPAARFCPLPRSTNAKRRPPISSRQVDFNSAVIVKSSENFCSDLSWPAPPTRCGFSATMSRLQNILSHCCPALLRELIVVSPVFLSMVA